MLPGNKKVTLQRQKETSRQRKQLGALNCTIKLAAETKKQQLDHPQQQMECYASGIWHDASLGMPVSAFVSGSVQRDVELESDKDIFF